MPKNVMCKKCNNLKNAWCEKVIDSPDPDIQRDCQHFWEKTNADRIRAMSDEELAETLVRYDGVYDVYRTDDEGVHYDWDAAVNAELEWLKQPADDWYCADGERRIDGK